MATLGYASNARRQIRARLRRTAARVDPLPPATGSFSVESDPTVPLDALILLHFSFRAARGPTECPRVKLRKSLGFSAERGRVLYLALA